MLANAGGIISDVKHSTAHAGTAFAVPGRPNVVRGTLSQLQNPLPALASLSRAQLIYLSPEKNFSASMSPETNIPLAPAKSEQDLESLRLKKTQIYLNPW